MVLITKSLGLSGMPEGEDTSLTSLWLPGAQQQRKLLVTGVLATVLTMAEMYNGSVTRVLRYLRRYAVLQTASGTSCTEFLLDTLSLGIFPA